MLGGGGRWSGGGAVGCVCVALLPPTARASPASALPTRCAGSHAAQPSPAFLSGTLGGACHSPRTRVPVRVVWGQAVPSAALRKKVTPGQRGLAPRHPKGRLTSHLWK